MKTVRSLLLLVALIGPTTCYYMRKPLFIPQALNWDDAQAYCRNNFVDLLTSELQEYLFAWSYIQPHLNESCWIGLNKSPGKLEYSQWSDGTALKSTYWQEDEPRNKLLQHCVYTIGFWWYDDFCSRKRNFFCYTWAPELIVVQEMKTWDEALKHCRTFYTDLVSLTTARDLFVINNVTKKVPNSSFWIGLRFLDSKWFWVDREALGNVVSLPSCPAPTFHCGAKVEANVFENRNCAEKMEFICYYEG